MVVIEFHRPLLEDLRHGRHTPACAILYAVDDPTGFERDRVAGALRNLRDERVIDVELGIGRAARAKITLPKPSAAEQCFDEETRRDGDGFDRSKASARSAPESQADRG